MTRPEYYRNGQYEVKDVIKAFRLDFNLGNVVKYIARAGKKDGESKGKDIDKALTYLKFELEDLDKYGDYDPYHSVMNMSPDIYTAYTESVIKDWDLSSDMSVVLDKIFHSSIDLTVKAIREDLQKAYDTLYPHKDADNLIGNVRNTVYTKDYMSGWNAAMDDVCEYVRQEANYSEVIGGAEVIGHCEASYQRS